MKGGNKGGKAARGLAAEAAPGRKRKAGVQDGAPKASAAAGDSEVVHVAKKAKTKHGKKSKDSRKAAAAAPKQPAGSNWMALKKQIGATGKPKPKPASEGAEGQGSDDAIANLRPEAKGSGTSLTPVVSMDCEMVGVGPDGKISALARVCLVNSLGNVLMDEHVQQKQRVTDYRTFVSGIRPKDLKEGALPLEEVQQKVHDIVKGRILIGHAIHNDLAALMMCHPRNMIRDTAKYPPLMREPRPGRKPKPRALRKLSAEQLGFEIQAGEHSPVDDARCALYLYQKHRKEWEKSLRVQKAELIAKSKANKRIPTSGNKRKRPAGSDP